MTVLEKVRPMATNSAGVGAMPKARDKPKPAANVTTT